MKYLIFLLFTPTLFSMDMKLNCENVQSVHYEKGKKTIDQTRMVLIIKANKKISNLNNSYGNWNLMFNIEKGELKEIFDSGKHKSQITYRCLTY